MHLVWFSCLLALSTALLHGAAGSLEDPLHSSFRRYVEIMKTIQESPLLRDEWSKHIQLNRGDPILAGVRSVQRLASLNCGGQLRSTVKPTSVHRLLPGDIDVVGAIGDSLTAGNGVLAWTILGCLTEYRGRSWSIGGDRSMEEGTTTFPNILRQFNPNLKGFSTGSGDANSRGAWMNAAVAGAIAQDMPTQAQNLVTKMRADSTIDFENDWKMVTLFIGGNNLCAFCEDLNAHSADTYISNIVEALDYLQANMPRTFVNLVEIFDIAPVAGLGNGLICNLVHSAVCSCGHGSGADVKGLSDLSKQYQTVVQDLLRSGKYDNREDFTVVGQPFLRETAPPLLANGSPDMSYFAPDCFHFSEKGQNVAGKALWNTLIQPVGGKNINWGLSDTIECPTTPYLPTKMN